MRRAAFPFAGLLALLLAAPLVADENRVSGTPEAAPAGVADPPPGANPAGISPLPSGARPSSHKVVLITDESLNPGLVALDEGQLVAWISYSTSESTVVFARDVARDMRCHSLVNFSFVDDELRSAPIHAGEFASFCELRPGRYGYKVVRPDPPEPADAPRELQGEIRVGNPES